MKHNEYGFVYLTTNLINGKKYIGQRKFSRGHEKYLGSGTAIKKAIKKYGVNSFSREILCVSYSKDELDNWEYFYICAFSALHNKNFYNMRSGGDSPGMTEETRNLMSLNSGVSVDVRHFEITPTTRGNFKRYCRLNGLSFDDYDEFDSGHKTRNTRKFFYKAKILEIPKRVEQREFTTKKQIEYYETNETKRNTFKKVCSNHCLDFNDFVEVSSGNKTKWGHALYTYYKK